MAGTSSDGFDFSNFIVREVHNPNMSLKLPLRTFGLASYKFKASFWNGNGLYECDRPNSLLRLPDNWLKRLQVNHPDYRFFISHNSYMR